LCLELRQLQHAYSATEDTYIAVLMLIGGSGAGARLDLRQLHHAYSAAEHTYITVLILIEDTYIVVLMLVEDTYIAVLMLIGGSGAGTRLELTLYEVLFFHFFCRAGGR
jgi:hypothetical protein